ncbi:MAG: dTDP-4-dehydrorhamnose 3,5-epimerase [Candidatus Paceibacterota bacterium]|jgi:dTDP-4-dehydrorhamnose 3,5-epimerase
MIFKETKIKDLYIIKPELKIDERGNFARTFCKEELKKQGLVFDIVQANQSLTVKKGTIRGMHFQKESKAEGKIVQCLKGKIYDVAVDLRKNSLTYGQWVAEKLTEENKKMFFLPKGFAHGFQTLSGDCIVQYFMSEFHFPEYGSGVRYNDPFLNIAWPIKNPNLSEKDKNWPLL